VTIDLIAEAMNRAGWNTTTDTPLTRDDEHGARTWWSYEEPSGAKVHQWTGSWANGHGDLVTYVLRYELFPANSQAVMMKVSAIHTTAATVEKLRKAGHGK
jgi:hypothetical protein